MLKSRQEVVVVSLSVCVFYLMELLKTDEGKTFPLTRCCQQQFPQDDQVLGSHKIALGRG